MAEPIRRGNRFSGSPQGDLIQYRSPLRLTCRPRDGMWEPGFLKCRMSLAA